MRSSDLLSVSQDLESTVPSTSFLFQPAMFQIEPLEIKNIYVCEIKTLLHKISMKLDTEEENISKHKDIAIETIQTEAERERKRKCLSGYKRLFSSFKMLFK